MQVRTWSRADKRLAPAAHDCVQARSCVENRVQARCCAETGLSAFGCEVDCSTHHGRNLRQGCLGHHALDHWHGRILNPLGGYGYVFG